MAYEYTSSNGTTYYLHTQKDAVLRGGVKRTIYYFCKSPNNGKGEPCDMPDGYYVKEHSRNKFPFAAKKDAAKPTKKAAKATK